MPNDRAGAPLRNDSDDALRGVVAFDMDGTLLDSMALIGHTAAVLLHQTFGTSFEQAERMYYRTTGKPFELQLQELFPEATPFELQDAARKFHEAKAKTAYPRADFFPEVPKLLKRLDKAGWKLVLTTGAEREMAELILERGGLGFLFDEVLGAKQGTKDQHLREFQRRWPGASIVLVGDSRFDMEAGGSVPGVTLVGRACRLPHWEVSPADMRRWGARWADYRLDRLPEVLEELLPVGGAPGTRGGRAPPERVAPGGSETLRPGALTYTGRKKCTVASCRRRATWRWRSLLLCDDHLREEARSARQRPDFLRQARERPEERAEEQAPVEDPPARSRRSKR